MSVARILTFARGRLKLPTGAAVTNAALIGASPQRAAETRTEAWMRFASWLGEVSHRQRRQALGA